MSRNKLYCLLSTYKNISNLKHIKLIVPVLSVLLIGCNLIKLQTPEKLNMQKAAVNYLIANIDTLGQSNYSYIFGEVKDEIPFSNVFIIKTNKQIDTNLYVGSFSKERHWRDNGYFKNRIDDRYNIAYTKEYGNGLNLLVSPPNRINDKYYVEVVYFIQQYDHYIGMFLCEFDSNGKFIRALISEAVS